VKIITDVRAQEYSGRSSGFRDTPARRSEFEEYDAGEYETSPRRMTAPSASTTTSQTRSSTTQSKAAGKAPERAPEPVMNLLDFDDTEPAPAAAATNKALPALAPLATNENGVSLTITSLYIRSAHIHAIAGGDDDFTDFQAAPSSPPAAAATTTTRMAAAPVAGTSKPNLMDLLASTAPSASRSIQSAQPQPFGTLNTALAAASSQQLRPSSTPATAPAFTGMPVMNPISARSTVASPVTPGTTSSASASIKTGSAGGGFDDLWSMSLGSAASGKHAGGAAAGAKSIRDLEKEKAQAGIWGGQSQMRPQATASSAAGAFGSFVKPMAASSGGESTAGADDLLL
jgi:epsin